jgi:hypothetical protein
MDAPINRRFFLASTTQAAAAAAFLPNLIDVRDHNAVGDGKTDDTAAIQAALNKAAETQATVHIPEGVFCCSTLKIPPYVALVGNPTWSYGTNAGSVLRLTDATATCLLDITGAFGVRISGLCLDGAGLGNNIHGVHLNKFNYGKHEDAIFIERCRINHFSGDGIHLTCIWVFTVRHCMVSHNGGNGLQYRGWDGWVLDNWLSGNGQAGIGAYDQNASCTFTANRIEWNRQGGIILMGGNNYNMTGNYIDRSGGPAISLLRRGKKACQAIAITGSLIWRSGAQLGKAITDEHLSTHIRFEGVRGVTFVGNALQVSRDDNGRGMYSPNYAMVLKDCAQTVISNNALFEGALKELILDLGEHGEGFVLKDNPGSLFVEPPSPPAKSK